LDDNERAWFSGIIGTSRRRPYFTPFQSGFHSETESMNA
jgi:hypothetical protein